MSDVFLSDLLSLYEPKGEAYILIEEARADLVSASGPTDPHEIGRLRGQIDGLRRLKTRLEAKAQVERESPKAEAPAQRPMPRRIY